MKIKPAHYQFLKSSIQKIDKEKALKHYESLKSDSRIKTIKLRFAVDLMYAANLNRFICDTLYAYLEDTHINTALQKICIELYPEIFDK